jgi:hypothetical protein
MSFCSDLSADRHSFNTDRCDLRVILLDVIEAKVNVNNLGLCIWLNHFSSLLLGLNLIKSSG